MAENDRCPRCGAMVLPTENFCAKCGAPLNAVEAVRDAWQPGAVPVTIEQLRAFCAYNGMPLEKMRFFVGENYQNPRAFGIYREGDQFVVYKNKDDGSRAVRYHGPDEAHAVGALYAKLLDECHRRNIWPDIRPEDRAAKARQARRTRVLTIVITVAIFVLVTMIFMKLDARKHAHDGYYRFNDDGLYYLYGDDWYYDYGYAGWMLVDDFYYGDDYDSYYMGDAYDSGWGYSDFERSAAWEQIQEESRTQSGDYDSWDSGGTDWSSDW